MAGRGWRAVVGAACGAALLAACTNGGGAGADPSKGPEYQPGPLDEYLAQIYDYSLDPDEQQSAEEMQAESDRQQRRMEELVAVCMAEEGFEYTPSVGSGGVAVTGDDLDVEYGSKAFAEKYGYGISTDPWGFASQGSAEAPADPNQEYLDGMSEGERDEYYRALFGDDTADVDEESGEAVEYDWTKAGCNGRAMHEVYDTEVQDEFTDLRDQVDELWTTMQDDPQLAALNEEWAACMSEAGYDVAKPDDAQMALSDEWMALQGWDDPAYQEQLEGWDWEAEPEGPAQPTPDPADAADFTEREIAQALADWTCRDRIDYDARVRELDLRMQREFVDAHRAELDAWVEAANAARATSSADAGE